MLPANVSRQRVAAELAHESFSVETTDHEDHTFSGIMFDVSCTELLPMDYVVIESVWVRGALGPLKVYYTPDTYINKYENPDLWTKVYDRTHGPSPHQFQELRLDSPIVLRPGNRCGLYVHSALPGDEAIVYDNQRRSVTHKDSRLIVHPGMAHLNPEPFDSQSPWGAYGNGWRLRREFVGRLSYSVRWLLWNPDVHMRFPKEFRDVAVAMLLGRRQQQSLLSQLPVELVWLILNKCQWDWFGTSITTSSRKTSSSSRPAQTRHVVPTSHPLMPQYDDGVVYGDEEDDDDDDDRTNAAASRVQGGRGGWLRRLSRNRFHFLVRYLTGGDQALQQQQQQQQQDETIDLDLAQLNVLFVQPGDAAADADGVDDVDGNGNDSAAHDGNGDGGEAGCSSTPHHTTCSSTSQNKENPN